MNRPLPVLAVLAAITTQAALAAAAGNTTEFCLEGEFNLGYRLQGHRIGDSWVPHTWCVITDDDSDRVVFTMTGKANPDMSNDWRVAYLPPDTVRIVNRFAPPDVEFQGTNNTAEALSVRRMDPRRLLEEARADPIEGLHVGIEDGRVKLAAFEAILPVHGVVRISWSWHWANADEPRLIITSAEDLRPLFRGRGSWRPLSDNEAGAAWRVTPGADKIEVPGEHWPARMNLSLIELADGVYLARGVRTGFQHLVVDTSEGLVVADAPASWLEPHQLPARRFLDELPIDGLSEHLIRFLADELPDRPILAVALTHFHDDHAGGAPAFAAAGAAVFAPAVSAGKLEELFGQRAVPDDEPAKPPFEIIPVAKDRVLGTGRNRVRLVPMGDNPHVVDMLGVWAVDRGYFFVSDVHVPRTEDPAPGRNRAITECWFAGWAVDHLPPDVQVVNSHSPIVTPVARLARYADSEPCRDPGR